MNVHHLVTGVPVLFARTYVCTIILSLRVFFFYLVFPPIFSLTAQLRHVLLTRTNRSLNDRFSVNIRFRLSYKSVINRDSIARLNWMYIDQRRSLLTSYLKDRSIYSFGPKRSLRDASVKKRFSARSRLSILPRGTEQCSLLPSFGKSFHFIHNRDTYYANATIRCKRTCGLAIDFRPNFFFQSVLRFPTRRVSPIILTHIRNLHTY